MLRIGQLIACLAALPLVAVGQTLPVFFSVGVYMDFDHRPESSSLDVMKQEVIDLLKASHVALYWRSTRGNHGTESFSRVVVLKFKGQCEAGGAATSNDFGTLGETTALGFTLVKNGRVLPYSEVECDQVRKALAYLNPGAGESEREHALGLALGRVVAHELYHILARTTAHAGEGLAKASQSLRDLISPRPGLLKFRQRDSGAMSGNSAE